MDERESKRSLSRRERGRVRGPDDFLGRARDLRRQSSDAERALWRVLRGRRLDGYKFRRQVVIEPYIVDFVCLDARLIIEADGGQHADQAAYDSRRTSALESMGYRVLRFWNDEILGQLPGVLERIGQALRESPSLWVDRKSN